MALTAQQAWMTWQGTPYETDLNKYSTTNSSFDEAGNEQIVREWLAGGESGFLDYMRRQQEFAALQQSVAGAGGDASMLVNYDDFKDDPAKVTAELTRKQWEDYKARFRPVEDRLMYMTTYNNPELVNQEIASAIGTGGYVHTALNNSASQQQRNFARYGLAPTRAQQTSLDRQNNLSRSTAVVDAANRIRQRITERNQLIATGTIPNAGRSYGLKTEA